MTQVTVGSQLRSRLNGVNSEAELLDESGAVLGYFVAPQLHRELLLAWSRTTVSDEELERASQEPNGRSLEEIWTDLAKR